MTGFTEIHVLISDDNPNYIKRLHDSVDLVNEENKHKRIRIVLRAALSEEHFIDYIQDRVYDYVILDLCLNGRNDESLSEFQQLRKMLLQSEHGVELYKYVKKYSPESSVLAISNMPVNSIRREFHNAGVYAIKSFFNKKETDEYTLANYIINNVTTGGQRFVNNIFVVYGHNQEMRSKVERYVRRFGINIIELDRNGPGGMQTVFAKLYQSAKKADCAIVLMSGDDHAIDDNGKPSLRARQNVIFEAGMFLGRLSPEKVIVLKEDASNFEMPSDLGGLHPITYDSAGQWKEQLKRQLNEVGFELVNKRNSY